MRIAGPISGPGATLPEGHGGRRPVPGEAVEALGSSDATENFATPEELATRTPLTPPHQPPDTLVPGQAGTGVVEAGLGMHQEAMVGDVPRVGASHPERDQVRRP